MKLSRADLNLLIDESRKQYIEFSGAACLPGTTKRLTNGERIAISWLAASILVLNKMGWLDQTKGYEEMDIEMDFPDCTTMTDGYDAMVDLDVEETK